MKNNDCFLKLGLDKKGFIVKYLGFGGVFIYLYWWIDWVKRFCV